LTKVKAPATKHRDGWTMKILMLYGTTEGQTRKIVEFVAQRLTNTGHVVTVMDAMTAPAKLDPRNFDAAILAASVHIGRFQPRVVEFAHRHRDALNDMNSMFLAVSLSAAGTEPEDQQGLTECIERFKRETGWRRFHLHHVAGAFRFTQYDFFKTWAMRYIAWRKNMKTASGQNLEMTDWQALAQLIDDWSGGSATQK